jgi:hypothetical protein
MKRIASNRKSLALESVTAEWFTGTVLLGTAFLLIALFNSTM